MWIFLLMAFLSLPAVSQRLAGRVLDAKTKEPVPFAHVSYDRSTFALTDEEGRFSLPARNGKLRASIIGYDASTVQVRAADRNVEILISPSESTLAEATVRGRKTKYSRKDNPAVALMRRVIEAKRHNNLRANDFCTFQKYSKHVLSLNEVTEKVFDDTKFRRFPNIREHVETCNETGKLILPVSIEENLTEEYYRRSPHTEKTVVQARRKDGVNEFFATGDIVNEMLKDCFTDVDIYDEEVRLLQYPFISPISTHSAISFYRYFIADSLTIRGDSVIRVDFTPNNPQDFGFSGSLYISKDSTYRVVHAEMGIPRRSDVNFVENLLIFQDFETLPTGEQVLVHDDMIVEITVLSFIQKLQVRRTTSYSDFSFTPIPDDVLKIRGPERIDPLALMRSEDYWDQARPEALTESEGKMNVFMQRLQSIKGFKPILWIGKAFIENNVETSIDPRRPSKVDIGPINTTISQNSIDGLRLRASAQTTANLSPHLFLKAYTAYGFKDTKWKGLGELTYAFNKKGYRPPEFPVNNLTFTYWRDVNNPTDKFLPTDKDNVFVSFKWTTVDHMQYFEMYRLQYDREWENTLRLTLTARHQQDTPCGKLFYLPLSEVLSPELEDYQVKAGANANNLITSELRTPNSVYHSLHTTDVTLSLSYRPGTSWVNTKQRRLPTNLDAPHYRLTHTSGIYNFAGRATHAYHLTEASVYKRFWLRSWGKIDATLKAGIQWSRVPFPLLIQPAANLSYIKEDETFSLINNMEFPTDRYASLMVSWDLNGKIFNRIPLLRRLKWREFIGVNTLWGTLTHRNDPTRPENAGSTRLLHFPGRYVAQADGTSQWQSLSRPMDAGKPYVEVLVGIHNIFKILHIEYVRRLTYLDQPSTHRWGIRGMLRLTF